MKELAASMIRIIRLVAQLILLANIGALSLSAQSANTVQGFDVASIKKADPRDCQAALPLKPMPGRLEVLCASARALVRVAYGGFGNDYPPTVLGGPSWLDTEKFAILATAPRKASVVEMCGPMLKALLETRFEVKIHEEAKETAVYTLTQAKGGATLKPSPAGSCIPMDPNSPLEPGINNGICGVVHVTLQKEGLRAESNGITMPEFAGRILAHFVDRPVVDKTGLTQRFDIRLVFADPRLATTATTGRVGSLDSTAGPSLFDAVRDQLGLSLVPGMAPQAVLVIDHISRPSAN